jgi:glycerophosphoryl diester phosphodiesterase
VLTGLALSAGSLVAPPAAHAAAPCPVVIAHRGTGAGAHGGTVAAFRDSNAAGATVLEMDVRFTRTGVPVVSHDATVHGVPVASSSYTQLAHHHLTTLVPTLAQVLAATHRSTRTYVIELKTRPTHQQFLAWSRTVDRYRVASRVVVESFDAATLRRVRSWRPSLRRYYISTTRRAASTIRGAASSGIILRRDALTAAYVDAMAASRIDLMVWMVNSRNDLDVVTTMGVRKVMTDRTADLVSYGRTIC